MTGLVRSFWKDQVEKESVVRGTHSVWNIGTFVKMGGRLGLFDLGQFLGRDSVGVLWMVNVDEVPDPEEDESDEGVQVVGVSPSVGRLADQTGHRVGGGG